MFQEMKNNENGFTLVELIVVIAIMAVLATLLIPRIMGNVSDASKQRDITTAQTLASEITIYNAKQLSKTPAGTIIKAATVTTAIAASDLTGTTVALPTGTTFPSATNVEIFVDANGNATITTH